MPDESAPTDAEIAANREAGDRFIAAYSDIESAAECFGIEIDCYFDEDEFVPDEDDDDPESAAELAAQRAAAYEQYEEERLDALHAEMEAYGGPSGAVIWLPQSFTSSDCESLGTRVWHHMIEIDGGGIRWEELWRYGDVYWVASDSIGDEGMALAFVGRFITPEDALRSAPLDWTELDGAGRPRSTFTMRSDREYISTQYGEAPERVLRAADVPIIATFRETYASRVGAVVELSGACERVVDAVAAIPGVGKRRLTALRKVAAAAQQQISTRLAFPPDAIWNGDDIVERLRHEDRLVDAVVEFFESVWDDVPRRRSAAWAALPRRRAAAWAAVCDALDGLLPALRLLCPDGDWVDVATASIAFERADTPVRDAEGEDRVYVWPYCSRSRDRSLRFDELARRCESIRSDLEQCPGWSEAFDARLRKLATAVKSAVSAHEAACFGSTTWEDIFEDGGVRGEADIMSTEERAALDDTVVRAVVVFVAECWPIATSMSPEATDRVRRAMQSMLSDIDGKTVVRLPVAITEETLDVWTAAATIVGAQLAPLFVSRWRATDAADAEDHRVMIISAPHESAVWFDGAFMSWPAETDPADIVAAIYDAWYALRRHDLAPARQTRGSTVSDSQRLEQ